MKSEIEIQYLIGQGEKHLTKCDCAIMKAIVRTMKDLLQDSYIGRELQHDKRKSD